jgi:hypothetical protein
MGCNTCNNKKQSIKTENFYGSTDVSNYLSKYWIFVVIALIIIIGLIYLFILKPKSESN